MKQGDSEKLRLRVHFLCDWWFFFEESDEDKLFGGESMKNSP